jgi:hypothetical protein
VFYSLEYNKLNKTNKLNIYIIIDREINTWNKCNFTLFSLVSAEKSEKGRFRNRTQLENGGMRGLKPQMGASQNSPNTQNAIFFRGSFGAETKGASQK